VKKSRHPTPLKDSNQKVNPMISLAAKRTASPWVPTVFCVFLSAITVVSNLGLTMVNHSDYGGWAIPFLCFLPMCFFFVGAGMAGMRREILELQKQVGKLRQHNNDQSDGPTQPAD
jgi:hypothetical protein